MLKMIYTRTPQRYNIGGIEEVATVDMTLTFDDEASYTEILAEIIKLLEFMGYSKQDRQSWENMTDLLVWDGYITETKKEEVE